MKRKIKSWILNYLSKYFELKVPNTFTKGNQFNVIIGDNSFFEKPNQIDGGKFIIIGNNSHIGHSCWLSAYENYLTQHFTPELIIGDNVRIGNYACITCIDQVFIDDGCLFSDYVYVSDHFHGFDPQLNQSSSLQPLFSKGKVYIGKNTFIGYRVTILSGVTIGKNCIIGAHSVVNTSFPDYTMIAGVPARLIKKYDFEQKKWTNLA